MPSHQNYGFQDLMLTPIFGESIVSNRPFAIVLVPGAGESVDLLGLCGWQHHGMHQ